MSMTWTPSPYLKFQKNFNSNYQYMHVHYITITSLPVYNLESLSCCNSTDEDPRIETFGPRT